MAKQAYVYSGTDWVPLASEVTNLTNYYTKSETNALPGRIVQVVSATYSTQTSNTSATFADTGLSLSITPTSTTNKILIIINMNGVKKESGNAGNAVGLRLLRDATTIISDWSQYLGYTGVSSELVVSSGINYLDSPATTSATTYKIQFNTKFAGQLVYVQRDSAMSTITLMEVAV